MTQEVISIIEVLVLAAFILARFFKAEAEQSHELRSARKRGAIRGGCLVPAVLFVVVCYTAGKRGDIGGPLFWPLLALLGAALGYAIGTLYFIVSKRRK